MKKLLIVLCFVSISFGALAQNDKDTTTLNNLKAPASPVAQLLSFSPSSIVSIQEKTKFETEIGNVFTKAVLPKSFGVSVAPFKLRGKSNKSWQNLTLSVGYKDSTEINLVKALPKSSQLGLGFSWSFIGKSLKKEPIQTKKTQSRNAENYTTYLTNYSKKNRENYSNTLKTMLNIPGETSKSDAKSDIDPLVEILAKNEEVKDAQKAFFRQKNAFQFFNGWAFDASGGAVWNQSTRDLDQYGFWLTASWSPWEETDTVKTKEHQHSFLAVARLLKNGDNSLETKKDKAKHHADCGIKYTYHVTDQSRFFVESEFLFRAIDAEFTSDKLKYKTDVTLGYQIRKNFVLTASFGRDFGSKTFNKSGNLFALLNIVGALGAEK